MKYLSFLILSFILLSTFSCKKKKNVDCDATICIINHRTDTVRYCWGCNSYSEKLPPGGTACRDVGHIKIKHGLFSTDESTTDAFFNTSMESYQIPVDECNEEHILE